MPGDGPELCESCTVTHDDLGVKDECKSRVCQVVVEKTSSCVINIAFYLPQSCYHCGWCTRSHRVDPVQFANSCIKHENVDHSGADLLYKQDRPVKKKGHV